MGKRILIYNHSGSRNHGCEALVRTIAAHLPEDSFITLLSDAPEEDAGYGINEIVNEILPSKRSDGKNHAAFIKAYVHLKLTKDYFPMDLLPYEAAIKSIRNDYDLALSIGGDVYCYDNYPLYIAIHKLIRKKAKKTLLIGCSLEEKLFDDPRFTEDLKTYDFITARESMTYELLNKNGIKNVRLIPDSAFTLAKKQPGIAASEVESVGINLSPLVMKRNANSEIVMNNYRFLIRHLLETTDYAITLVPHVSWNNNDDSVPLRVLYEEFSSTNRITLINDCSCEELKFIISTCSFFIGARTHSTIAAYSSGIPTLVVGYSIKSKGIAKDLFGDYERYVIAVNELKKEDDVWNRFEWIMNHSDEIKNVLADKTELYSKTVDRELRKVFEE
ncbi:MAG: polysaccharide pyruvyl transferase family protein [Solobacterium sp.]|nr:polysaccharide pyruvyl transferase family protein [Solobacterium sp.]